MFFLFGSFNFIMGVFVYFFVPETKGVSLERMDELFGADSVSHKVADDPENNAQKANDIEEVTQQEHVQHQGQIAKS